MISGDKVLQSFSTLCNGKLTDGVYHYLYTQRSHFETTAYYINPGRIFTA